MSAYATYEDVAARTTRTFSEEEQDLCTTLLSDAAVLIDSYNKNASADVKLVVSCNMVIRAMGNGSSDIPIGATQGSMSAMGYSESWTLHNGSVGELYLSKTEKRMLGVSNAIGSHSPVEDIAGESVAI